MKTVYMDYAATTYVKPEVLNEMTWQTCLHKKEHKHV